MDNTAPPFATNSHATLGNRDTISPVKKPSAEEFPPAKYIRYALVALITGLILTDRAAVSIGTLPLGMSLPLTYILLATLLLHRCLVIDTGSLLIYVGIATLAIASFLFNTNSANGGTVSIGSVSLLLVIYLPFVFSLTSSQQNNGQWRWMMRIIGNVLLILALAGIVQFYVQFVFKAPWLFDASLLLPDVVRGGGVYNSAIPIGSFFKSNGFFSREPSGFSYLVAFGLLLELSLFKRLLRILVFAMALLLSYSGTGLLMLTVGLLFPFTTKKFLWVGIGGAIAIIGNLLLGDPLNLALTFSRVGEFSSEGSSAYARYVAPMQLLSDSIDSTPWSLLLGHGPGTIISAASAYEAHDPTWAKLLFEYGVLGFVIFIGFVIYKISAFPAPIQFRVILFASWLITGGQLLAPENVYFLYVVLGLWPRPDPSAPSSANATATAPFAPNNLRQELSA